MKRTYPLSIIFICFFITCSAYVSCLAQGNAQAQKIKTIIDAAGRQIVVPARVNHILCSGAGCLRLITYLESQDKIVAVDDLEKRRQQFDARPYALANPQFNKYPIFGEFRGHDNPEIIMGLSPRPQVIFKTFSTSGYNPLELQEKTGIPVVILEYGDMGSCRDSFFQALKIAGSILGKEERAGAVINFFESHISELNRRTLDLKKSKKKNCYSGPLTSFFWIFLPFSQVIKPEGFMS